MATLEQVEKAFMRAHEAGDTEAAQLLANRVREMRAQSYVAPEVDPATANMDPRDVQAQRRPSPATSLLGKLYEVYRIGPAGGVVRGARDVAEGAVQAGAHLGGMVGAVPESAVRDVDRAVQQSNREYLYETGRKEGELDAARLGGRVGATLAVTPARLLRGATTAQRAVGAGAAGALSGVVEPVTGDENPENSYAFEKAKKIGVGTVAGLALTPAIEKVLEVAVPAVNRVVQYAKNAIGTAATRQQIDNLIAQELDRAGVRWQSVPVEVREALHQDVRNALRTGDLTDPEAMRRLVDLRAVGVTPTRGSVTLKPTDITAEKNAAKIGAGSTDPEMQKLALLEGTNNARLIQRLNEMGSTVDDAAITGEKVARGLGAEWKRISDRVSSLYDEARMLNGGDIPLNTGGRASEVIEALESTGKLPSLGAVGAKILNTINEGVPITIGRAEGMKTALAAEIRKAQAANDGNAEQALKAVYGVLEEAEPAVPLGQQAQAAYRAARDANRARMGLLEKSPALREIYSEKFNPETFFQRHVLSSAVQPKDLVELRRLTASDPAVLGSIRGQIVNYLKKQALSGASDEVGTFSQSGYNKALQRLGERKLRVFFGADEIAQMQQLGRAASYLQVQPKGSAVNNSNTAAGLVNALDRMISGVPFAGSMLRSYGRRLEEMDIRAAGRNALRNPLPSSGAVPEGVKNALVRSAGPASIAIGMGLSQ